MKKRVIVFFLALTVFLAGGTGLLIAHRLGMVGNGDESAASDVTFLILGLDEAASNTDMNLLVRYTVSDHRLVLLQLPRDTYMESGEGLPKLNHIYASCLLAGADEASAARQTASVLSEALQIRIDGCAAVHLSAVSQLIDEIGGVRMSLPSALSYDDPSQDLHISLPAGDVRLTGDQALQYVRYRSGYAEGDLGRIDAQKLFLAAFLRQAAEQMTPMRVLELALQPPKGVFVSYDGKNLLPVITDFYTRRNDVEKIFVSLPGEATREQENTGTWYYVINHEATAELLHTCFSTEISRENFDPEGRFVNEKTHFENIYYANGYDIRYYSEKDLKNLKILEK